MNIFLYTGQLSSDGKRLHHRVTSCLPDVQTEVFDSPLKVNKAFLAPGKKPDVLVLLIANQMELQDFLSMKKVLLSTKIILVLPDRDRETIASAHKLFPRFISYCENDFSEVVAVLEKISETSAKQWSYS